MRNIECKGDDYGLPCIRACITAKPGITARSGVETAGRVACSTSVINNTILSNGVIGTEINVVAIDREVCIVTGYSILKIFYGRSSIDSRQKEIAGGITIGRIDTTPPPIFGAPASRAV